jgi:hypothetical protein
VALRRRDEPRPRARSRRGTLAGSRDDLIGWEDAVDRLSALDVRRYLGDVLAALSPGEIASALDTTARTVSTRLWRSLGRQISAGQCPFQ